MPGIISEVSQVRAVYRTITALSNVIAKGLIAHEALGWLWMGSIASEVGRPRAAPEEKCL